VRRLKEVVYTLSNHNQNVMSGLWKDLPYKITKKVKENWLDNLFFLVPLVGTYQCVPVPPPTRQPRARAARAGRTVILCEPEARCCPRGCAAGLVARHRGAQPSCRPRAAAAGHAAASAAGGAARETGGNPRPVESACQRAADACTARRYAVNYKEQEKLHHRY
jgi:hypothetical protein